ncbi:unnamed protein product [Arabidopsis halleri]
MVREEGEEEEEEEGGRWKWRTFLKEKKRERAAETQLYSLLLPPLSHASPFSLIYYLLHVICSLFLYFVFLHFV